MQRGQAVVVGELVAGVDDDRLDGAAVERALADDVEVLAALADVDGDGDDLGAGLLGDPADGDGGVEAAGVGEDDAVGHGCFSFSRCESGVVGRGGSRAAGELERPAPPGRARGLMTQHGVVAGDGAEDVGQAGAVERGGEELGGAGRGAQDDEVGRGLGGDEQLRGRAGRAGPCAAGRRCEPRRRSPPSAGTA